MFNRRFVVSPLNGCDMILRICWVINFAPKIDWEALVLTLRLSDGTPITIRADLDIPSSIVVPPIAIVLDICPVTPVAHVGPVMVPLDTGSSLLLDSHIAHETF